MNAPKPQMLPHPQRKPKLRNCAAQFAGFYAAPAEPHPIFCPKTFVAQANLKCYWPKSKLIEYAAVLPEKQQSHPSSAT